MIGVCNLAGKSPAITAGRCLATKSVIRQAAEASRYPAGLVRGGRLSRMTWMTLRRSSAVLAAAATAAQVMNDRINRLSFERARAENARNTVYPVALDVAAVQFVCPRPAVLNFRPLRCVILLTRMALE